MMHEDDDWNYWWDAKHTIPVEMKKGGGAVIPVEMKKGGGAVPREQKKVGEEEIVVLSAFVQPVSEKVAADVVHAR